MKKGYFITFEGIDGCGKSTQMARAVQKLTEQGFPVVATREPGGTPISEKIREILISADNSEMVNECEILLYCAARAQHVREKIIPAMNEGKIVVCDRFQEATFAYQGFGRGLGVEVLKQFNSYATGGLDPDLTFIFDISVEASLSRLAKMEKKKDRLEQNGKDFFEAIRNGYLTIARDEPQRVRIINGEQNIDVISGQVLEIIGHLIRG